MKFNRCFWKSFHWIMLAFWQIDMCNDWKKSSQYCTKCVWISKRLSHIYPLLQQILGKLISFSTIRHNVYLIRFTKCSHLLQQEKSSYLIIPEICPSFVNHWQTLQQKYRTCYKQIRCSHNSNILDVIFHWIFAAYFCLQNFNKKLIKERNLVGILWKKNFSKRNVLMIRSERKFNLWWTDRSS